MFLLTCLVPLNKLLNSIVVESILHMYFKEIVNHSLQSLSIFLLELPRTNVGDVKSERARIQG